MTDTFVRVILVGLAAWRVSALLSYERGPFGIFSQLRWRITCEPDEKGLIPVDGWLDRLRLEVAQAFDCVWCLSPWTAAGAWLLWEVAPQAVAVGAAAAIIVLVERLAHGRDVV